jgi:uncharacterized membrane protein YcgQ (UPF0703/DUF1980 family)
MAADTWIEVVGRYTSRSTKDSLNDGVIPYLEAEEVRQIAAPVHQYEE